MKNYVILILRFFFFFLNTHFRSEVKIILASMFFLKEKKSDIIALMVSEKIVKLGGYLRWWGWGWGNFFLKLN